MSQCRCYMQQTPEMKRHNEQMVRLNTEHSPSVVSKVFDVLNAMLCAGGSGIIECDVEADDEMIEQILSALTDIFGYKVKHTCHGRDEKTWHLTVSNTDHL